jgi:dTMP kinase
MFITFEGLDFSGKTTQARLLAEKLRALKHTVHFIREPGGTAISEHIRALLLDKKNLEMAETTEILLFSAARAQLVSEVIAPALRRGETLICDRYYDSTTAYQGYGRSIDLRAVHAINKLATAGIDPDLTLLVDIPVQEIARRKVAAGLTFDRMESAGREFYERVRNGYLEIARDQPGRFVRVEGMGSIEEVSRIVWQNVEPRLGTKESLRNTPQSIHL